MCHAEQSKEFARHVDNLFVFWHLEVNVMLGCAYQVHTGQ